MTLEPGASAPKLPLARLLAREGSVGRAGVPGCGVIGGSLKELAEWLEINYNTLAQYQTVSRGYDLCDRSQSLSWKHHLVAAPQDDRLEQEGGKSLEPLSGPTVLLICQMTIQTEAVTTTITGSGSACDLSNDNLDGSRYHHYRVRYCLYPIGTNLIRSAVRLAEQGGFRKKQRDNGVTLLKDYGLTRKESSRAQDGEGGNINVTTLKDYGLTRKESSRAQVGRLEQEAGRLAEQGRPGDKPDNGVRLLKDYGLTRKESSRAQDGRLASGRGEPLEPLSDPAIVLAPLLLTLAETDKCRFLLRSHPSLARPSPVQNSEQVSMERKSEAGKTKLCQNSDKATMERQAIGQHGSVSESGSSDTDVESSEDEHEGRIQSLQPVANHKP